MTLGVGLGDKSRVRTHYDMKYWMQKGGPTFQFEKLEVICLELTNHRQLGLHHKYFWVFFVVLIVIELHDWVCMCVCAYVCL